jgi:hypothetical protein
VTPGINDTQMWKLWMDVDEGESIFAYEYLREFELKIEKATAIV